MRLVFLDTSFVFALFQPRDSLHDRAGAWLNHLAASPLRLLTTRSVLVEFLASCSSLGPGSRRSAADFVQSVQTGGVIEVLTESDDLFAAGLDLYRARQDKTYSMTDCMAMELCPERGIVDVLTYDRDFLQEGFRALLREEPGA